MAGQSRILFHSTLIVCISVAVSMGFGKFQELFPCDGNHRCGGQPTCRKLSCVATPAEAQQQMLKAVYEFSDMNTTNVTVQIISNTSTVQSVPSHVTSNFQNGSGTSNLESSSYLTSTHQTVSPSSSVQSFLSYVTSKSQTVSDSSARRSISPKLITTIEPTATSIPSSPNTSEPQPQANLPTTNLFQCSCTNDSVPDGTTCKGPTDCDDVYQSCNQSDGVYTIKPKDWQGSAFDVYCNMDESAGWTVIQRRVEGETVDFMFQTWDAFQGTFGNINVGEGFWLGNEKIYHLTNQKAYILRIDFQCKDGSTFYAEYGSFRIGNETDKYRVRDLGFYKGDAGGDPLITLKNGECPFTTYGTSGCSQPATCPIPWRYGWWCCSSSCIESNLNDQDWGGNNIYWKGLGSNIKHTEMKLRPTH